MADQRRIHGEWSKELQPIATPRAGEVLGTIVQLLPEKREWTVEDVKKEVDASGVSASAKDVYNAIGYLARKGHVRRIGYGRYLVNGFGVETSDDLTGGSPEVGEG